MTLPNIIFILLTIIIIVALLYFVNSRKDSAYVYEQAYAKQIALLIDKAQPGMIIYLNIQPVINKFGGTGFDVEKAFNIDDVAKEVNVGFSGRGKYKYGYFVDYSVSKKI